LWSFPLWSSRACRDPQYPLPLRVTESRPGSTARVPARRFRAVYCADLTEDARRSGRPRTWCANPGRVLWGEVVAAPAEHRLARLAGSCSIIGIAGLLHWRRWLTRPPVRAGGNSVLAADVVTANGLLVRTGREHESDCTCPSRPSASRSAAWERRCAPYCSGATGARSSSPPPTPRCTRWPAAWAQDWDDGVTVVADAATQDAGVLRVGRPHARFLAGQMTHSNRRSSRPSSFDGICQARH
jgi:hypothetical protein